MTPGASGPDDAAWYHHSALILLRGSGYLSPFTLLPTASWPPGYSAVLALGYFLAGATPATVSWINAVFGALTCFFVWRIGTRLLGARGALVATALLAAFPSQIFFVAVALSETLFTCLACGLLLAAMRLAERPATSPGRNLVAWVLWGLAAGATALVRAEAMLLALAPAATFVSLGTWRTAGRVLGATVLGTLLALAPWMARNARLFGTVVPTATSFGRTLWIGHNPLATGGMSSAIQESMEAVLTDEGPFEPGPIGELARDRALRRHALAFALANPLREIALTPARAYHLFRGDHVWQSWYYPGTPRFFASDGTRRMLGRLGDLYYALVGFLAVAGWVVHARAPVIGWRLLNTFAVTWVAIFTAIYGDPRFHHFLIPLACVLAAAPMARQAGAAPSARHAADAR